MFVSCILYMHGVKRNDMFGGKLLLYYLARRPNYGLKISATPAASDIA